VGFPAEKFMTMEFALNEKFKEGHREGELNRARKIAKKMLLAGNQIDTVKSMTELSDPELAVILEEIMSEKSS